MNFNHFFWKLTGDDFNVIGKCGQRTKRHFTIIGSLVAFIFSFCFLSCYLAFSQLFRNIYVGVPVGLFFAWMITNIYLFLLYTLSKTGFPYIPNKTARYISTTIRVIFIGFIAIIVSKPIERLVVSEQLELELEAFKKDKLERYKNSTQEYFEKEIIAIKKLGTQKEALNSEIDETEKSNFEKLIHSREAERDRLIKSMEQLVEGSDYYIQGIVILNRKFPFCWFFTFLVIVIFIIPAYLKIYIHKDSVFYRTKHYVESHLVRSEYELFKERYRRIFRYRHGVEVQYTELYTDPPFNTIRKTDDKKILTESDLLDSLYA
ncbi:DUF4407 domain-containing protein [Algoriphagus halophytocola]|uniref:DUF4407 domain-containing protein n=1 Tax=Algoriphagus halophytocola TaxID=2991499 RepID=UPI0022DE38C6|nr:DUF4407 domain-containing protein [Algoriphagus sp. TR-M9]WBL41955.1 DUF4407 domain-containing protein [Algoriphagus sp. TR-M9]